MILKSDYLNINETTIPLFIKGKGKCSNAYLWGITSQKNKLVWFHYNNGGRGQKVLADMLGDCSGRVQSDACASYNIPESSNINSSRNYKLPIIHIIFRKFYRRFYESTNNCKSGRSIITSIPIFTNSSKLFLVNFLIVLDLKSIIDFEHVSLFFQFFPVFASFSLLTFLKFYQ